MSDNSISSTTQEFLDVYDITNNMTILKDGTVSVILRIGTMNFSLLAEQEQDAIIYTYGALLNSLNYPIQINIQSQTKDATKYLKLLDEQGAKASSQNKANLIKKYRNFVSQLIRERNVLEKKFFIIIPASPSEMGLISPKNILPGQTEFDIHSVEKTVLLEKAANILEPRRDHLISQCNRLGLFAEPLSTQEIIQNFYINYNPEAQEGQEITNSDNYKTPLVRASFSRNTMQNMQNNLNNPSVAEGKKPAIGNPASDPTEGINLPSTPAAASTPVATPVVAPAINPNPIVTPAPLTPDVSIPAPIPAPVATTEISTPTVLDNVDLIKPKTPAEALNVPSTVITNPVATPTITPVSGENLVNATPTTPVSGENLTEVAPATTPTINTSNPTAELNLDSKVLTTNKDLGTLNPAIEPSLEKIITKPTEKKPNLEVNLNPVDLGVDTQANQITPKNDVKKQGIETEVKTKKSEVANAPVQNNNEDFSEEIKPMEGSINSENTDTK